jgi:hypothetical protein
MTTPDPALEPSRRDARDISPTDSYRPADRVWVYRSGTWCAGIVEACSPRAATVTYRPNNARGTGVDTLTASYLLPRADRDPLLDAEDEA